ncbi:hypothetical protein PIB30_069692, partial [Stylosanthes scabra]|nr:hypothetical protein [Stylosanthes scabra]
NRKEETTPWLCPQLMRELMFYWDNDPRYTQNLETKTQQSDKQSVVEDNGSNNYVHVDSKAVLPETTPGRRSVSASTLQSGHLAAFPTDSSAPPPKPVTVAELHDFMHTLEDKDCLMRESEDQYRDLLAYLDKRESMIKENRQSIEASCAEILRSREKIREMMDILRHRARGSSVGGGSLSAPIPPMPQEDDNDNGQEDDADT